MLIDFNKIKEICISKMNDGIGDINAKMYNDDNYRIIFTKIPVGSSIGKHTQTSGDDINYIISGIGKAVCDGIEEILIPESCHICFKNSEHSIINTGSEDLVILTIVVKK